VRKGIWLGKTYISVDDVRKGIWLGKTYISVDDVRKGILAWKDLYQYLYQC